MVVVIFERTFSKGASSNILSLLCGVLQGSVRCPHGFIARPFGVGYHFYADDTLVLVLTVANESKVPSSLEIIEHCIANIWLWLTQNQILI